MCRETSAASVVYRDGNRPAAHVKIEVRTNGGQLIDTYFTEVDGRFSTPTIPNGQYVITVEAEGYKPYRRDEELLGYPGNPSVHPTGPTAGSETDGVGCGARRIGKRVGITAGGAGSASSGNRLHFFKNIMPQRACHFSKKFW